jgi:hypothetical protein
VEQGEPWQAAPRPESAFYNEKLPKQYLESAIRNEGRKPRQGNNVKWANIHQVVKTVLLDALRVFSLRIADLEHFHKKYNPDNIEGYWKL